jgi:hypothetical protein
MDAGATPAQHGMGDQMAKSIWCGLLCLLLLTGCKTFEEMYAEADNAKCQSYGSRPGEPAYVQCRAQLDAARSVASSVAFSHIDTTPSYQRPAARDCLITAHAALC